MYTGIKKYFENHGRLWCANVIIMVKYVEYNERIKKMSNLAGEIDRIVKREIN